MENFNKTDWWDKWLRKNFKKKTRLLHKKIKQFNG
jgi:hypothetical protein